MLAIESINNKKNRGGVDDIIQTEKIRDKRGKVDNERSVIMGCPYVACNFSCPEMVGKENFFCIFASKLSQ